MLLTLRSDALEATIDPTHGGEVVALRERGASASLLAETPWSPTEPRAGDLDMETWTAAYRGGWQLLTPNAGDVCEVDGVRHGYHGRASNDPWEPVASSERAARLRWRGHGLVVTRTYELTGSTLRATTRWEAEAAPAPMVHVEHVALGRAMLDPDAEVRVPPLRDGTPARSERRRLDEVGASFAAVGPLAEGRVEVVNAARGSRVRLEWDATELPWLWLWRENRGTGGIWDHRAEMLGIEPAATFAVEGLGRALELGQAIWVEPGRPIERRIALHVERA